MKSQPYSAASGALDGTDSALRIGLVRKGGIMIRRLKSGQYRIYSRKLNPKTGKRRNLGTFATKAQAEKHEREIQYFKRH